MTQVPVYSVQGTKKGEVALPAAFDTPVRVDVIRKAVAVAQANRRQRYGASYRAGMMHSTKSAGKGKGQSRVPRIQGSGAAALAPPTVGGRRAHPPEARRNWDEKINNKERRFAIRAALAATAQRTLVVARGHRVDAKTTLPLVVEDGLERVEKTKDILAAFERLGLAADLERAKSGVHVRAGRGKMRGRRYRSPVSLLLVAAHTDRVRRGARNLTGVDVVTPQRLNAELLAPGGQPGRLTVFTESALKALEAL